MYVNVLIENAYEVRVMFDSIRIDSKCPGDASCYCAFQCAAWVRIPIPTYFRSQEVYITGLIPSGVSWLGNTHA